jgi:hypothetical protein
VSRGSSELGPAQSTTSLLANQDKLWKTSDPELDRRLRQSFAGDGVVFDAGHPDQDEEGGRVYTVETPGQETFIGFGHGDQSLPPFRRGNALIVVVTRRAPRSP